VAWTLLVLTFPMISIGGLVTTYEAGMSVPDWPNTFGHNLFLYPLRSWLGNWDVFLEHGHRLLGTVVGTLTFVLAFLLWKGDKRPVMKWLGLAAVTGVCLQGLLGGLRVCADEIVLAKIHGCTAPLYFALLAAIAACTSPGWRTADRVEGTPASRKLRRWTLAMLLIVYLQITLGAQLRHVPYSAALGWFTLWVWLHLIAAGTMAVLAVVVLLMTRRHFGGVTRLRFRATWLAAMVFLQLILGAAVWITNYNFPVWFTEWFWRPDYTVVTEGLLQVVVTTAHVGVGSLCLVAALSLLLWSRHLVDARRAAIQAEP
jgi:cytochrome c oxidase assembly protein subunit 15